MYKYSREKCMRCPEWLVSVLCFDEVIGSSHSTLAWCFSWRFGRSLRSPNSRFRIGLPTYTTFSSEPGCREARNTASFRSMESWRNTTLATSCGHYSPKHTQPALTIIPSALLRACRLKLHSWCQLSRSSNQYCKFSINSPHPAA